MTVLCCCSCSTELPKYKCPICRTPYCSVQCCHDHKLKGCSPQTLPVEIKEDTKPFHPTEDTLPRDKLENLKHNTKLRECLTNPHLRHIMNVIDKSNNPTDLISQAMLEPIFVEFATECLKVVDPNKNSESEEDE